LLLYDNVTTAQAASQSVVDRLSTLVTEWRAYSTQFATNPYADFNLPQVNASVEAQRTAVYVQKRDARVAADAARDAAQAAKEACERGCAADRAIYDFLVYDVAFMEAARATVNGLPETSQSKDFVLGAGAFSGNSSTYEALLNKKRADLTTYAARVRSCEATCAALGASLLSAQQAADAALAAERAALADVIAVCPTFNASTV
jgi:hypothetical protein